MALHFKYPNGVERMQLEPKVAPKPLGNLIARAHVHDDGIRTKDRRIFIGGGDDIPQGIGATIHTHYEQQR